MLANNYQGQSFLEQVREIARGYSNSTHIARDYPIHGIGVDLNPNGFHFGIMHPGSKSIVNCGEGNYFRNGEEGKRFMLERDRIWKEWMILVKGY